jgi:lantibiotic modifying enzyme
VSIPPRGDESLDRRALLRAGLSAAALAALPRSLLAAPAPHTVAEPNDRPHLAAARRAERWIRASRIATERGANWPADPRDTKTTSLDLYNGWPGVVLFCLELHHATGDADALAEARAGADELLATVAKPDAIGGAGLYTGAAGIAFVLSETHAATGDSRYRTGARAALDLVAGRARQAGDGVEWGTAPESTSTDIISGGAGIGLTLLAMHRRYDDRRDLELATRAGRRLASVGIRDGDGLRWAMTPSFAREMPNFSHGTAGVSYFLAELFAATGDRSFLDAARGGARYLERVSTCHDDACSVFHHTNGGEELYYLGWCHGPAGTARLFHRLAAITRDRADEAWVARGAKAITTSGVPEARTPGFWNNVSVCCGNAGVADFFLQLYRARGDATYLAFAERTVADLMRRSTDDDAGLRWVQAENRVSPDAVVAQTGFMQGAAGIGSVLLRFDALQRKRRVRVVWPDSPWPA